VNILEKIKALPLKKILIIGVPVLVLIIAAIILIPVLTGPGSTVYKDSISFFTNMNEVVISGNNNAKFTIDGDLNNAQRSLDGSKAVVLTDMRGSDGGALWFVTTSKVTKIADDVLAFRISDTGNAVLYLTDYDSRSDVATLYHYDTSRQNSVRITEEAMYNGESLKGICISPDGKTVAYISKYDSRDDEYKGYIKVGNRAAEEIGKNQYALVVSNNGATVYYVREADDYSASLHVKSGRNDNRLITEIPSFTTMWVNKDYTQVIFNHDDRANMSKNGGERERIYSDSFRSILLPQGTQQKYTFGGRISVVVVGVRSLTPLVAITNNGLVHLNNKNESNRISSSSDHPYSSIISADGRTLLFLTNSGHLASIDPSRAGADRNEVGRNVSDFVASSDVKTIYFVNEDEELFYVRGNAAPSKVSDDVNGQLAMQWNSTRAFFIVDSGSRGGELYYSNNGRARTRVPGGNDVMGLRTSVACVFYVDDSDDIYRSNGNEKFTRFAEDVDVSW